MKLTHPDATMSHETIAWFLALLCTAALLTVCMLATRG